MDIKIKIKETRLKCLACRKSNGKLGFYIIDDEMDTPKVYHAHCVAKIKKAVLGKKVDK